MNSKSFDGLDVIDISMPLGPRTPVYPGDPPFERRVLCSQSQGQAFELSSLHLSAHAGTHIETPKHFIPDGQTLDQAKPGSFILPVKVIQVSGPVVLESDLAGTQPQTGRALIFRTRNSSSGLTRQPGYHSDYAHLSLEAAQRCLELGAPLVGLDYLSVDRHGDETYPVHKLLLGSGCYLLEGLDLADAQPGDYLLICLPLNIEGGEASPVRAVLAPHSEIIRLSLTLEGAIY